MTNGTNGDNFNNGNSGKTIETVVPLTTVTLLFPHHRLFWWRFPCWMTRIIQDRLDWPD
jgi:hypothetical protein